MEYERQSRLLRLVIVAAFAAEAVIFIHWIPDDAYVSFRYARNLAHGAGLVFNPGDRVEGMSNPLWTVVLALFTRMGLDTVWTAVTLSFACALASVVLALRLFDAVLETPGDRGERRRFFGLKLALSVGLVVSFPSVFYATSGMETHAETVALLAGVLLHLRARSRGGDTRSLAASQAAFLCAAFLRPEGILFLVLGGAFTMVASRNRTGFLRAVLVAGPLLVYAGGIAVKAAYYGAVVPNTYLAKPGAAVDYLQPLWRGLRSLVRFHLVSGMVLMLPFVAIAFFDARRRYACVLMGAIVSAQLAFIVLVGGDVLRFNRFTVPFVPFVLALALVGFVHIDSVSRARARSLALGSLAFCVLLMGGLNVGRAVLAERKECVHDWMQARVHRAVGAFLGEALPSGSSVVANEVGAIAYESGLVTYDMIGLTDATVGRIVYESYHRFGDPAAPESVARIAEYLMAKNPTCVIVPSYGPITARQPSRPDAQPPGNPMHPIWAGVFHHPTLAQNYRCWFGLRIQDAKFWYFYIRNDVAGPAPSPEPMKVPDGVPCATVLPCRSGAGELGLRTEADPR
jgi:arabinofuranosyltransferase